MPEIITKYPEVVMQVLQGSGAKCGTGEKQKILTHCPPGQFCSLPAGEMCVYGIQDISHMQQVSSTEIFQIIKDVPPMFSLMNLGLLAVIFLVGLFIGTRIK
ncbi:MAG: hypothetical protein ACD_45C00739G0004 [uncultured bacterium]|nr:MAG: hypothetical protein ACD_45C00739G0004 [uncultured bacterium]